MFSCEFCKVFKNTIFTEHLRTTAFMLWQHFSILHYIAWAKINNILIDSYFFLLKNHNVNYCSRNKVEKSLSEMVKLKYVKYKMGLHMIFLRFWKFLIILDKLLPLTTYSDKSHLPIVRWIRGSGKRFIATVFFINSLNTKVPLI